MKNSLIIFLCSLGVWALELKPRQDPLDWTPKNLPVKEIEKFALPQPRFIHPSGLQEPYYEAPGERHLNTNSLIVQNKQVFPWVAP